MSNEIYDVIIIGGGPAGLTSALYSARAKLKTLVLEKVKLGGQISLTHEVANFPGSIIGDKDEEPSGPELSNRMAEQARKYGADILVGKDVVSLDLSGKIKTVTCTDGSFFKSYTLICANGAVPREIGCKGESELKGKGVSYCATCDGAFFEDLEVYVIGGGNSAVEEAIFLTNFARKVTIIQNLSDLTADAIAIENAKSNKKIHYVFDSVVENISGDGMVESMIIRNTKSNETTEILANEEDGTFGVFIFIGYIPKTSLYKGILELDEWGYLKSDDEMKTNIPGVFVAGDIRPKSLRQVVTAVSDGAIASHSAQKYIESQKLKG